MSSRRDYHLGVLFVTLSALAWSTTGFFTRLIPLDSFTLLVWRGFFATLSLLVVCYMLHGRETLAEFRRFGRYEWLYVAISICSMILYITSLNYTSVAHGAVIYATLPFLAAFLGWIFLRERPERNAAIASLAALVGVVLMAGFGSDGNLFGDFLGFVMTACMAGLIIVLRKKPDMAATPAACMGSFLSIFICLPFATPLEVSGLQLFQLALFGIINSAAGLAFFILGSKRLPAIETGLIGALDTPVAPLWVWLAFSETPGTNTIVGGTIVFVAVVAHILAGQRKPKTAIA